MSETQLLTWLDSVDFSAAKSLVFERFGRGGGDRTHDLRLKRPLLYH
jgi:hypothetical protein